MTNLTKKALADALLHYLEKKTLDEITIKELTDYCDLNRQTFYYHFSDVYDLTNWILFSSIEEVSKENLSEGNSVKQIIKDIANILYENKNLVTNLYHSEHIDPLIEHIRDLNYQWIKTEVISLNLENNINEEDLEFLIDFYSAGISGSITRWIDSNMEYDINVFMDKLFWIIDSTYKLHSN